jgi:hypothetical protein
LAISLSYTTPPDATRRLSPLQAGVYTLWFDGPEVALIGYFPNPILPQLHRTVSDNITYGKMVTWFVTSPPTDNSPQPKEALPTVSQL